MNYTKKMVLLTPEEAASLRTQPPEPSAPAGSLNALDTEMKQILEESGQTDQDKWLRYKQVLLKFMTKLRERSAPMDIMDDDFGEPSDEREESREASRRSVDSYNADVLDTYRSEKVRKKARVLLSLLRRNQDISWDGDGIVTIDGVTNSSPLHALLSAALSNNKSNRPPGWSDFQEILLRMSIPEDYVGGLIKAKRIKKKPKVKHQQWSAKPVARWRPY